GQACAEAGVAGGGAEPEDGELRSRAGRGARRLRRSEQQAGQDEQRDHAIRHLGKATPVAPGATGVVRNYTVARRMARTPKAPASARKPNSPMRGSSLAVRGSVLARPDVPTGRSVFSG